MDTNARGGPPAPLKLAFASFVLFALSAFIRFLALNQTDFANGWDGYFYINQVKAFLEEGQMRVPDVSLVYPLMIFIQFLSGDYILSYKLIASILAGSFTLSIFLLALKHAHRQHLAFIFAGYSVFIPHLTWFAAQFPKNLLGIVFFLWMLYCIAARYRSPLLALLILNFFGHSTTVGTVIYRTWRVPLISASEAVCSICTDRLLRGAARRRFLAAGRFESARRLQARRRFQF